jgi:hypothetical protein
MPEPLVTVPRMDPACTYAPGLDLARRCTNRATWHLLLPPENGHAYSFGACDEHFEVARRQSVDQHADGPLCDVPGSQWRLSDGDVVGCCTLEALEADLDEVEARIAAERSLPAHA